MEKDRIGYVLCLQDKNSYTEIRDGFKATIKKAGIQKHITHHCLRHIVITLGHEAGIYTHSSLDRKIETINKIGNLFHNTSNNLPHLMDAKIL